MTAKKLYFGLVSLISIVSMAISLGVILTSLGKMWLISDKEYLATHDYEFTNCEYQVKKQLCGNDYLAKCNYDKNKYEKLVKECKEQAKEKVLLKRYYYLKISLIGSTATFIIFLLLFLFHYPKFKEN